MKVRFKARQAAFFSAFSFWVNTMIYADVLPKTTIVSQVSFSDAMNLKNLGVFQAFEAAVLLNTTTRLVRWRPERIEPELAESWSVSSNGKTLTFFLRKDAKFSDGSPITSADVLWSVQRHFVNKGQHTEEFLQHIEGWQYLTDVDSVISGFQAINTHTFEVRLNTPTPRILYDFFGLLPSSIFKKGSVPAHKDDIPWNFISSGPYKIVDFNPTKVEFEKNPFHWLNSEKNLPSHAILRDIKSQAKLMDDLAAGNVDFELATQSLAELDEVHLRKLGLQIIPQEPSCIMLRPDFKGPILRKSPKLAAILGQLIRRENLVTNLQNQSSVRTAYAWTATNTLLEKEFGPFSSKEQENALKKGKDLYPKIFKGEISLTIAYDEKMATAIPNAIQKELKRLGINAQLKNLPKATITKEIQDGEFDFAIRKYGISAFDPALTLPYLVGLNPRYLNLPPNHYVYSIQQKLTQLPDLKGQLDIIREFNVKLREEGFIIPLMNFPSAVFTSARFDISRIPTNTTYIYYSDFRVKP